MAYVIRNKDNHPITTKDGSELIGADNFEGVELKDFSDKERSFLAVASTESPDRFKDVVMAGGWQLKNYRKNPVVMNSHNFELPPIGRSLEEFTHVKRRVNRLMFRPQFAAYEQANLMYTLFRDKYLKGFSVGFLPLKEEPIKEEGKEEEKGFLFREPTRYLQQELLEVSACSIPANADCLAEIKGMVQKGKLYIPARYLQEEQGREVEVYDEYIHVKLADEDKFTDLYEMDVANGIKRVFGHQKDKDENELFDYKFIFSKEAYSEDDVEDFAEMWAKEKYGDIDKPFKNYNPEPYSAKEPVVIELSSSLEDNAFDKISDNKNKVKCQECGNFIDYEKEPEIAMGAIKCPKCGTIIDQEGKPVLDKDISDKDIEKLEELVVGKDIEFEEGDHEVGEDGYIGKEEVEKPYPSEHSCRLKDPGKYDSFARKNCFRKSDGKCVDYIFGIKDGKSDVQAMRYKKDVWTAGDARSHCKEAEGTFEVAGEAAVEGIDLNTVNALLTSYEEKLMDFMISYNKKLLNTLGDEIVERVVRAVKGIVRKEKVEVENKDEVVIELDEPEEKEVFDLDRDELKSMISGSFKNTLGQLD